MKRLFVISALLLAFYSNAQVGKWVLKNYNTEPDLLENLSAFEKEAARVYLKNKTKGSYYDMHKDGTFIAQGIYKNQSVTQEGTWKISTDKKWITLNFKYNGRPVEDKIEIRSLSSKELVVAKDSQEYGYDVTFILILKKV